MTRIIVVRGTGASGVSLRPGEIADVSAEDARILISMGKARPYIDPAAPPFPIIDPELLESRDPVAETRDPTTESAAALVAKPRKKPK